ncbi:MAG: glycosyltransferase [bacterium]
MKIVIANSIFHPHVIGGAERATYLLARQLSTSGHQVHVLATSGKRSSDGPAPASGYTTRSLPDINGTIFEAPSWGMYDLLVDPAQPQPGVLIRGMHHFLGIHASSWRRLAARILDQLQPDVLHTHTIVGMTPAVWGAARACRVPVVHTLHDYHLLCPRTTLLRSRGTVCEQPTLPCRVLASRKLAATRRVAVVTAPSRFVLERHLAAGGFPDAKAVVVPNACTELPESLPDRSNLAEVQGLFLGQIDTHKGIPALLAALAKLFESDSAPVPASFRFAFAGLGPLVPAVEAFCLRFPDRCRYHGMVRGAEKAALMAASSFLVLPSIWHDNFPMVILEAFSQGMPVIGARRGGIPEIIENQVNGLVVEPEPVPLATALTRYAVDARERLRHGVAAFTTARSFSLERHVEQFLEIYREVSNG